jgi:hypothetical protein
MGLRHQTGKVGPLRAIALFILTAAAAFAVNVKLYLKDGTSQLVREYQVQSDRVRFYSVDLQQWDELPLDLVDLKRTEREAARAAAPANDLKIDAAKNEDEIALAEESAKIPEEPGVHYYSGDRLVAIPSAKSGLNQNKARNPLKVFSPNRGAPAKVTITLTGEHSSNTVRDASPKLYVQLSKEGNFALVRLPPSKGVRVVETLSVEPGSNEILGGEFEGVAFRRSPMARDALYRITPTKPLEPGEYAVVEYTPNTTDIIVWDFAIAPASK